MQARTNMLVKFAVAAFLVVVGAFFYQTFTSGKLPVPADALVGLYHPWRDLYAQQYPRGVPYRNFLITDPVREQIPWRRQVVDSFRSGRLPTWDATSYSGTPLAANIQSGAYYPLNILFLFLPFPTAWTMLIVAQPILGGLFMLLFLRNRRIHPIAALLGGIVFAFSGFSVAWMTWGTVTQTAAWIPLCLLAVDHVVAAEYPKKRRLLWTFVLGAALSCSFFAGHSQIFLYGLVLIGTYALVRLVRLPRAHMFDRLTYLFLGAAVALLLTAPVWPDYLRSVMSSSRFSAGSQWKEPGFFIPVNQLIQVFVPDFFGNPATLNYWGEWNYGEFSGYVGMGAALFVSYALIAVGGAGVRFWTAVAAIALAFATQNPIAKLPYVLHVPVIASLQPTRLLMLVDFAFAVLAAYGLHGWLAAKDRRKMLVAAIPVGLMLVAAWLTAVFLKRGVIMAPDGAGATAFRNTVVPTVFFVLCVIPFVAASVIGRLKGLSRFHRPVLYITAFALVALTAIDLIRFGQKFTPFTPGEFFFPQTGAIAYLVSRPKPFRIMSTDDRLLAPNTSAYHGLESVGGYDPVHDRRYDEFIAAMERGKPDIRPPFGFERVMQPKNIGSPLFRLLGVRYVLSLEDIRNPAFIGVFREGDTRVNEYRYTLPRVFFAERIRFADSKQAAMDTLYAPGFDPAVSAVVEYPLRLIDLPLTIGETATLVSYMPGILTIRTHSANIRLLVILNRYDDGWRATVDGKQVPTYRTDYIFTGVVVPEGSHTVRLEHRLGVSGVQ